MRLAGALLTALPLIAQSYDGLPRTAFIVESHAIPASTRPNREIILWMEHFEKIDNGEKYGRGYTCPEVTTGKGFYRGPTRISLRDTFSGAVINTIPLLSPDGDDAFDVPFRIARQPMGHGYYAVPDPLEDGEGKPELLDLKDYNGDGHPLEAAFFAAQACMGLPTTLIGYSIKQDRVIQYEVDMPGAPARKWVDYLFAEKPIRPGHWKYEIDYRGRLGPLSKYEIQYDPQRERFEEIAPR